MYLCFQQIFIMHLLGLGPRDLISVYLHKHLSGASYLALKSHHSDIIRGSLLLSALCFMSLLHGCLPTPLCEPFLKSQIECQVHDVFSPHLNDK